MGSSDQKKSSKGTCCTWVKGPICSMYVNYFLSSWGDRMWQFAAGLYLVFLSDGDLRLAAIFGFTGGTLMLIFGGIIGDWVDRNGRMKVVAITLFIQNLSVAFCATSVCLTLLYEQQIDVGMDGHLRPLVEAIIISLALSAYLSSMAYKIAIEKDWIVVIASGNNRRLSNMNTVTRAIDLTCELLAPCVAGILMSYSHTITAICIALWNVISVFCEYTLLRRIYNHVPALAVKGVKCTDFKEVELQDLADPQDQESQPLSADKSALENPSSNSNVSDRNLSSNGHLADQEKALLKNESVTKSLPVVNSMEEVKADSQVQVEENKTCLQLLAEPFLTLAKGWKTYLRQKIKFAGLSLAFLYMTVLGFDSVTIGYVYANGVKETFVGMAMAGAGLTGIMGTFIFSRVNPRLGLHRTGLISFSAEILCLTLTVASIWAPGSVFDPSFSKQASNCTQVVAMATTEPPYDPSNLDAVESLDNSLRHRRDIDSLIVSADFAQDDFDIFDDLDPRQYDVSGAESQWLLPWSKPYHGYRAGRPKRDTDYNSSIDTGADSLVTSIDGSYAVSMVTGPQGGNTSDTGGDCTTPDRPTLSIILFLVGVVASRIGLWMSDLVVTQTIQENVPELERGIFNGVQNSLNMLNDMIKFALVIALPKIETFGILIILSFCFICFAGLLFLTHVWKTKPSILRCESEVKGQPEVIHEVIITEDDRGEAV